SKLEKILQWLSPPDYSTNHSEARKKHKHGTGEWLLRCREYQDWISGSSSSLWLHGKAGCCKTVLCSIIIKNISAKLPSLGDAVLSYFYFSFANNAKQSYASLLLSMVTQLSRKRPIHPTLTAAYDESQPNRPNVSTLEGILIALVRRVKISYLVIDALDEC
ncbi:hypothetical protein P280DRAFT_357966, partial [Massarina eburnea CBS 473.64]